MTCVHCSVYNVSQYSKPNLKSFPFVLFSSPSLFILPFSFPLFISNIEKLRKLIILYNIAILYSKLPNEHLVVEKKNLKTKIFHVYIIFQKITKRGEDRGLRSMKNSFFFTKYCTFLQPCLVVKKKVIGPKTKMLAKI